MQIAPSPAQRLWQQIVHFGAEIQCQKHSQNDSKPTLKLFYAKKYGSEKRLMLKKKKRKEMRKSNKIFREETKIAILQRLRGVGVGKTDEASFQTKVLMVVLDYSFWWDVSFEKKKEAKERFTLWLSINNKLMTGNRLNN